MHGEFGAAVWFLDLLCLWKYTSLLKVESIKLRPSAAYPLFILCSNSSSHSQHIRWEIRFWDQLWWRPFFFLGSGPMPCSLSDHWAGEACPKPCGQALTSLLWRITFAEPYLETMVCWSTENPPLSGDMKQQKALTIWESWNIDVMIHLNRYTEGAMKQGQGAHRVQNR